MGCASSTPMIATAGSDMLKAATHVASDAAKGAEHAMEEATETVGKTLENAKETVGTAVTGIAHDLGNVFTEKSGELDTAKNQLLERLHLGGANKALKHTNESAANHLDAKALEMAARAPTPPLDLDSLKTSTPEPEIERALANSREDTPPTPKPTIAELEKLTAEVKPTTQTTAVSAAAATNVVAEAKDMSAEVPTGTTAATEPAVDMVALLAAEKRPGTTEWEKHADHLSKTRKMNEFKGGGKFRRFGPPTQPAKYQKPIENLRRTLLEDDSCYSDAYYNSHSSPQHSTASDSPRLRRARLPINGVLAANAKRMQREFATFVSNRRNATSALRSLTVSPGLGRHFDYNPQRPRISSPTPSVIGYTRSGYSTPVIMNHELVTNPRTAGWKRSAASSRLRSPPSHIGRVPPPAMAPLDLQVTTNAISQTKLKSTKAFASLRGETNGRSRIFGQTRSGSPVNRRVFAKRTGSSAASKRPTLYVKSGSPERIGALIQDKEDRKYKVKPLAEASTKIRLEREASIKESKEASKEELPTNGFSLSKALSPIKLAAESHSLPHLQNKTTVAAHSLMEVVEQAIERAKNRGDISDENVKGNTQKAKSLKTKKDVPVKNETQSETQENLVKMEKKDSGKMNISKRSEDVKKEAEKEKSPNRDPFMRGNKPNMWIASKDTSNSTTSSSRTKNPNSSPMRRNSKGAVTVESNENNNANKHITHSSPSSQKYNSPQDNGRVSQLGNYANKGRFSMSPNKKHTPTSAQNEKTHNMLANTSPNCKETGTSLALENNLRTKSGSTQNLGKAGGLSPNLKQRDAQKHPQTRSPKNNALKVNSSSGYQLSQESKIAKNNDSDFHKNNWKSSSKRSSEVEYTNISNRFESNAHLSDSRKEKSSSPSKYNNSSPYHEQERAKETEHQYYIQKTSGEVKNLANNCNVSVRRTQDNFSCANNISEGVRVENTKHRPEGIKSPQRETQISTPRTSKISPVTNSTLSREQKNNEYNSEHLANYIQSLKSTFKVDDNLSNNHTNVEEKVKSQETPNHQVTNSPIKQITGTETGSPDHNSHNSSPSKSSKSSSSIVIRTNLSTPETEDYDEDALNHELSEELEQLKHYDQDVIDKGSFSQQPSIEENSQTDLEEYSRTDHEESYRTDDEGALHTDVELSSHTELSIYSADSTSLEDLVNTLSPQTAYLNLGRSATTTSLKPKTSILKPPSSFIFHNPSHSSSYRRHSSSCESDQLEKVLFIGELSSVARSRSARVLSPYKMRDRCDVCFNKYVIK